MSKLTHLCLGACGVLVLVGGLIWMPIGANAAPGDPQDGPSGPTASSYANNEQYGYEQQGPDAYGREQNGRGEYSEEEYGNQEYGSESHEEYGEARSCDEIHKIALGENLTTIAASYGVSVEALAEENGIEDTNLIVENQALCIPAHDGNSYGERGSYENGYAEPENSHGNQPYMEPGKSYDPSYLENKGEGYGPREENYGPQENSYGEQSNGNQPYMVPGKSYDPSYLENQGNGYGEQENGYGPQNGPQEESYGNQESYYGVPGKAYDPSAVYDHPQYDPRQEDSESFDFDDDNPEDGSDPDNMDQPQDPGDTDPGNGG